MDMYNEVILEYNIYKVHTCVLSAISSTLSLSRSAARLGGVPRRLPAGVAAVGSVSSHLCNVSVNVLLPRLTLPVGSTTR